MHQDPGPEAERWLRSQSIGGPWYEALDPQEQEKVFFRPQHRGEDQDPWRLETVEPGPPQQQQKLGTVLPAIERHSKCPGYLSVPEILSRTYDRSTIEKKPKLYVLAFPGCADAVNAGWAKMEIETPEYFEWATYEWPGHGERVTEPRFTDIADIGADAFETFREYMSTGHFMLMGHSIGALIMTYVCMRAERQLGVKPVQVFVLDRVAPHQLIYSPYADYMRRNEPLTWLFYWNRNISDALKRGDAPGSEDTAAMLQADEALTCDTLPPGSYKFPCKVNVFIALWMSTKAPKWQDIEDEAYRKFLKQRCKYYCNNKGYNFDPEEFEEWRKWADDVTFTKVETDHKGVVTHTRFLTVLYREVQSVLKKSDKLSKQGKEKGRR